MAAFIQAGKKVAAYITERLSVGAAKRDGLKRMFSLGVREKKVSLASVPSIRLLKERSARKGFVEHDQYLSLRNELPDYLKPILALLYYTGVRDGEALALKWNSVDLAEREIRIEGDATKNDEGKTLPLDGELLEVLKVERAIMDSKYRVCEWVFHRSGKRLQSFYKAWHTTCVKAGLGRIECPQCSKTVEGSPHCPVCKTRVRYGGLIPHDLRRTAIRNMV